LHPRLAFHSGISAAVGAEDPGVTELSHPFRTAGGGHGCVPVTTLTFQDKAPEESIQSQCQPECSKGFAQCIQAGNTSRVRSVASARELSHTDSVVKQVVPIPRSVGDAYSVLLVQVSDREGIFPYSVSTTPGANVMEQNVAQPSSDCCRKGRGTGNRSFLDNSSVRKHLSPFIKGTILP